MTSIGWPNALAKADPMMVQCMQQWSASRFSILELNLNDDTIATSLRYRYDRHAPVEYRERMHFSMKSRLTARIMPMDMIPPAPPCMEYVAMGARGMSQYSLKMPRVSAPQMDCGVHGHPMGASKGGRSPLNLDLSKRQGRQRGACRFGWDARPGVFDHHM